MSRPRNVIPTYRLHRKSGQAIITLYDLTGGRRETLLPGPFGSAESKSEYARIVAEYKSGGPAALVKADEHGVTVNELLLAFWQHAQKYYVRPDGSRTSEVTEFRLSLKPVRELYGATLARDFSPLALKTVRQQFVAAGNCRTVCNRRTGRIKHVFKWGAGEQLVPATVYTALQTVAGLPFGRSTAPEREPIRPVADAAVDAVLPYLTRYVRGMVELLRVTGMRPGEVCQVRACDISMGGNVWLYSPPQHKTAWRNKARTVAIGPRGQQIVKEFLTTKLDDYLFSPQRCREELNAEKRARRRTPVQPSQVCRAKAEPRKRWGERYTSTAFAHAIHAACRRAGIAVWSPNRIRHSHASLIRKRFGLEGAQVALGHSRADVTQVYAERDLTLAERIASEVG